MEGGESDQEVAQVRGPAPRQDGMRTAPACHPLSEGALRRWGGEKREAERKRKVFSGKHEGPKMKPTERQNMPREHQTSMQTEDPNIPPNVGIPG